MIEKWLNILKQESSQIIKFGEEPFNMMIKNIEEKGKTKYGSPIFTAKAIFDNSKEWVSICFIPFTSMLTQFEKIGIEYDAVYLIKYLGFAEYKGVRFKSVYIKKVGVDK